MNPARVLGLAALGLLGWGCASLWMHVTRYLDNPRPIDSNAGLVVFSRDGGYVSYRPYEIGMEPGMIGVGVVLLVAAVLIAAVLWRPRVR